MDQTKTSMLKEFANLSAEEEQLMFDAIPLITLLVAGADGEMDRNELAWAEKLTSIRSFANNVKLNDYYKAVGAQFDKRLKDIYAELPEDSEQRTEVLVEKMTMLNGPMKKINEFDAAIYYQNFLSFAKHVAKASGGIMRFMSIGPKEAKVIELPMLDKF